MLKRYFVLESILFVFSLFLVKQAFASEGIIQLGNINGTNARCFAMSTLINRSDSFQISMQCRNLTYPIGNSGSYYVLWETPVATNSSPVHLGELGFGKESFTARSAFSKLFVTEEQTQWPKQPSQSKIMEGSIQPIFFLDREPTPTPSPTRVLTPTPGSTSSLVSPSPTQKAKPKTTIASLVWTFVIIMVIIALIAAIIFVVFRVRKAIT